LRAPKPGWVSPKTAWGDPDISGNFTNKYEQGTPMERPAGFEGRRVDGVRGAELNKLLEDRQRQSDARQPFLAGDPTGRIAVLPEFGRGAIHGARVRRRAASRTLDSTATSTSA
jgi:hypothetical protein